MGHTNSVAEQMLIDALQHGEKDMKHLLDFKSATPDVIEAALAISGQPTPTPQADEEAMRKLIAELERDKYRQKNSKQYKEGMALMLTDNQWQRLVKMAAITKHVDTLNFLGHVLDKVEELIAFGVGSQVSIKHSAIIFEDLVNPTPVPKKEEVMAL